MTAIPEVRAGKKRKRHEVVQKVNAKEELPRQKEGPPGLEEKLARKSSKKKKKSKAAVSEEIATESTKPEKKIKKTKHASGADGGGEDGADGQENTDGATEDQAQRGQRFIVFIGNLPFTASKTVIEKHFAIVKPISVRHITHKDDPSRSKGFAFLEFEHYDRMKTCLKLFHHSSFDDGVSPARKLNVELTAGGGGSKSKERKTKLRTKNVRLQEQRSRRAQEEARQKLAEEGKGPKADNAEDVHPSRRSRVPLDGPG